MKLTPEQIEEFSKAAAPLMEWLNATCHPHCTALVTSGYSELVEGVATARPRTAKAPAPQAVQAEQSLRYQVVVSETQEGLGEAVDAEIRNGWVPCGGVSVSAYQANRMIARKGYIEEGEHVQYAQAMTKTF